MSLKRPRRNILAAYADRREYDVLRLDGPGQRHMLVWTEKRSRCVLCSANMATMCEVCDLRLCSRCYKPWHTVPGPELRPLRERLLAAKKARKAAGSALAAAPRAGQQSPPPPPPPPPPLSSAVLVPPGAPGPDPAAALSPPPGLASAVVVARAVEPLLRGPKRGAPGRVGGGGDDDGSDGNERRAPQRRRAE